MFAKIAFPGFFLTFLASLLLLLTTVSTPVAKNLYFLQVSSNSSTSDTASTMTAATLRLGTLGYCLSGNSSTAQDSAQMTGCTSAKIGYDLGYGIFSDGEIWGLETGDLSKTVRKGLTYLLVFQPLAAISALISLTFAFFAWCCGSRIMEIIAMLSTTLASLVAWIAFITAVALFATVKHKIQDASNGDLEVKLGNCLWMSLGAALSLSIAICCTCVGTVGHYKSRSKKSKSSDRKAQPYPYVHQQEETRNGETGYPAGYPVTLKNTQPTTNSTTWK